MKLEAHQPEWDLLLRKEIDVVKSILGSNLIEVHHIGSTAIPNILAKPIIDLMPVVRILDEVDKAHSLFEFQGYLFRGEYGIAGRRYVVGFKPDGISHRVHFHIYPGGHLEIERHLVFRDYLRSNPEEAKAYENLKLSLQTKHDGDKSQYQIGKADFCERILKQAMNLTEP